MNSDDVVGGIILLVLLLCGIFLIYLIGSSVCDFINGEYTSEPIAQPVPITQNLTNDTTVKPISSDWNKDYWHNRLKERTVK